MSRVALALVALLGVACTREAPRDGAQPERAAASGATGAASVPAPGSAASADVVAPGSAASAGVSAPDQPPGGGAAPLDSAGGLGLTGVGPGGVVPGFALGAGSREEREARVYALLAGERPAGGLPVRAGLAKEDVWVRDASPRGKGPPRVRIVRVQTGGPGALPVPVVQRILRQNYGRFRLCYENALRVDPRVKGTVTVRFVIGKDGAVRNVSGTGGFSTSATQCVSHAFYGLTFPAPEGGKLATGVVDLSFEP